MSSDRHRRPFAEIEEDYERAGDAFIWHYFNGYKRVMIKRVNDKIVRIRLRGFVEDSMEIVIAHGRIEEYYNISSEIIDPLKYRYRNIIEKHRLQSSLPKDDLLKKLMPELAEIVPLSLREDIKSALAY